MDRPSKQRTTVHISPPSKAQSHMKYTAADLFDAAGEKWIVLVDRYSDYAWTDKLKDTSTVAANSARVVPAPVSYTHLTLPTTPYV